MDFGFWVLDFGFWVLDFGFWALGFGFGVLGFGFWILGFGFLDFGFWGSGAPAAGAASRGLQGASWKPWRFMTESLRPLDDLESAAWRPLKALNPLEIAGAWRPLEAPWRPACGRPHKILSIQENCN